MTASDTRDIEQQRLAALRLANSTRQASAELKRRVATGVLSVAEILRDPPAAARRCSLRKMLMSQPRWGPSKCHKLLLRMTIGESKLIGDLTERQRGLLATQLGPTQLGQAPDP